MTPPSSNLRIGTERSVEMSEYLYQTTRRHIPEDTILRGNQCDNLRSYIDKVTENMGMKGFLWSMMHPATGSTTYIRNLMLSTLYYRYISRLLYRRGRKSRRDLWITLYTTIYLCTTDTAILQYRPTTLNIISMSRIINNETYNVNFAPVNLWYFRNCAFHKSDLKYLICGIGYYVQCGEDIISLSVNLERINWMTFVIFMALRKSSVLQR
jgi:hypothetical protein